MVRLADGLEVRGTFGRRTGSPWYVWPTDWKSVVRLADGLEVCRTKIDPTEGEALKVVLGTGFSYWGNRPTKTPIPLLTPAGASTIAIIT